MDTSEAAVMIRNGCKAYGRGKSATTVLHNLNMNVPKGLIYGLLGASGCGKTTILGCIAGRLKLDSGELRVLGATPGMKGSGIPGPRIGYMPQEISLIGEMNVWNVFHYFGWMYGMSNKEIEERHSFLTQLLELPDNATLIKNYSGGQQRRVSLAVALIQTPELLILDEPTVGLDPLLRQSIWEYLVEISRDMDMTIIITTHYIEEATQAHKIGLLREGTLLADAAPDVLIAQYNRTTLEEVFLLLSRRQEAGVAAHQQTGTDVVNWSESVAGSSRNNRATASAFVNSTPFGGNETKHVNRRRTNRRSSASTFSRMRALLYKDFLTLIRNRAGLPLLFIFPILQVVLFFSSIGGDFQALSFGVVNDEIANCGEMIGDIRKASGVKFNGGDENDDNCHYFGLSCLLIDQLGDDKKTLKIIHYADQKTALAAANVTINQGTLYIPGNFSTMLEQRYRGGTDVDNETIENSEVKVWLDMSDYIIGNQLKKFLYERYVDLANIVADGCGENKRSIQTPVKILDSIPGVKSRSWRDNVAPILLLMTAFFLATISATTTLADERASGTWDRNLVAGATLVEIILSHVTCHVVIMVMQVAELLLVAFLVFDLENNGSLWSVILFVCLQSIDGVAYGLFITAVTKTSTAALFLVLGTFLPYCFICGAMWPVLGQPLALRYVAYATPGTLATLSLNNVLAKGYGLLHMAVWPGLAVSAAWAVVPCMAAVFFLSRSNV